MKLKAHLPCKCGANRWKTVSKADGLYQCRVCGHMNKENNCYCCAYLVPCADDGMIGLAKCNAGVLSCCYEFSDSQQLMLLKKPNDCHLFIEKSEEEKKVFRRIIAPDRQVPKNLK